MESLLNTPIWNGQTLGDFLTIDFLASLLGNVLAAILILIVGFWFAGWVYRRVTGIADRYETLDETLFDFLGSVARYTVIAFTFLFVLNTFGVQTTSIVAVIGAAGLAIGLALQGTLSNVAAGVMLILFRPLKTGDFVEVNGVMGTVKSITLNWTEIATIGNVQVIVPNSEVWGQTITNYSTYPKRQAEWTFGVSYGADLDLAERTIRETLLADPRTHTDPEPFIKVNGLGASSVDFLVRAWCDRSEYFAYQADMKRAVKEALDRAGVDIPFPTRTIIHQNAATEEQMAAE